MGEPLAFRPTPSGGLRCDAPVREYRRAAHTVYALHYHFVFITKYRKPVSGLIPVLRKHSSRDGHEVSVCGYRDCQVASVLA